MGYRSWHASFLKFAPLFIPHRTSRADSRVSNPVSPLAFSFLQSGNFLGCLGWRLRGQEVGESERVLDFFACLGSESFRNSGLIVSNDSQ